MNFTLECEQVVDGRWNAEVPELPGMLYYGSRRRSPDSGFDCVDLRIDDWMPV